MKWGLLGICKTKFYFIFIQSGKIQSTILFTVNPSSPPPSLVIMLEPDAVSTAATMQYDLVLLIYEVGIFTSNIHLHAASVWLFKAIIHNVM